MNRRNAAALAIYQGEEHAQTGLRRSSIIAFWRRMPGWFDRYTGVEPSGMG